MNPLMVQSILYAFTGFASLRLKRRTGSKPMPSDLVWVALITSGAVLASSWLTAKWTNRSAQQQIAAQSETVQKQIDAQAEIRGNRSSFRNPRHEGSA